MTKWAKKSGKILGDNINLYPDKEREKFQRCIYNTKIKANLGEFSAGSITALLLIMIIGIGSIYGITKFYLGINLSLFIILGIGIGLGFLGFIIFHFAPSIIYKSKIKDVERNIVKFVPTLSASVASGLTINDSIKQGAKSDLGYLSTEFTRVIKWDTMNNDFIGALYKTKNNIDSDTYSRIMGTIMHIKAGGVTKIPDLPPSKQPVAQSLNELRKEERDKFKERCNDFENTVDSMTTFMNILFTIFPLLMIVLSVVMGIQPGREMLIGPVILRSVTVIFMPLLTFFILFFLSINEPT
ncbi:MAG: hypothetical protein ACOCRX_04680 [Candidatus Woesearchaeota archaeon]